MRKTITVDSAVPIAPFAVGREPVGPCRRLASVLSPLVADACITGRQRRVSIGVYESFRRQRPAAGACAGRAAGGRTHGYSPSSDS